MTAPLRREYLDGPHGQLHMVRSVPASTERRPLLAFHLSPGSGRMYEPLLADIGSDRLAIAPDTPGHGASDPPPCPLEIAGYAEAMGSAIDHYALDSVDLLGYRTGSKIAVCLALTRPHQVNRLVLVSARTGATGRHSATRMRDTCRWRDNGCCCCATR